MATRSKLYLTLALCFNCFILTILILDSRSFSTLDINLGLLPETWDEPWLKSNGEQLYLHELALGQKTEACGLCSGNSTLCQELGEDRLSKAIWNRGSEVRLKRFLAKAKRGEGFTVGVVGGSVSAGHGLHYNHLEGLSESLTHLNMNRAIFDHLDKIFPAPGGSVIGEAGGHGVNGFVNGAQGGTGTDYFSMCFSEHIPEEVDLVLIDMSINDELYTGCMGNYELMLRGIMDLPNRPAIINLHIFALMFRQLALGGDMHSGINQFYDIPTISIRGPFLQDILADVGMVKEFFVVGSDDHSNDNPKIGNTDLRHLSANGHRRVSELVNAYINWQLCELGQVPNGNLDAALPRQLLMQKYDPDVIVPKLKPMCLSTNGKKHKLVPAENEGWEHWNWEKKNYIRATKPHSKVGFKFTTSLGKVQLQYLRSAIFGLGSVKCWVDDDVSRAVTVIAYWEESVNIGRGITVRDDLTPGDHILRCEVLEATADPGGGHEFRIISVMSWQISDILDGVYNVQAITNYDHAYITEQSIRPLDRVGGISIGNAKSVRA